MNEMLTPTDPTRDAQMDAGNIELRLHRLEQDFYQDRIPYRMQAVEMNVAQIQGEVVAVKEIARGIGTKMDSGIRELSADNTRNQGFIKGVIWIGGAAISVISPLVVLLAQQLLKQAS